MPSSPDPEFDLWRALEQAARLPQAANFLKLCQLLDRAIAQLPEAQQLTAASLAIEKMAEVYVLRANWVITEWEDAHVPLDSSLPMLSLETIESWVRQSMTVDLDALIEKPPSQRQRKKQAVRHPNDSIVAAIDSAILLEFVEHLEVEQTAHQMIQELAGEEHISQWSAAIQQWLQLYSPEQAVSLSALHAELRMPLVEIWLGLLLGGFALEQYGDFYHADIWVRL